MASGNPITLRKIEEIISCDEGFFAFGKEHKESSAGLVRYPNDCPVARYLKSLGLSEVLVNTSFLTFIIPGRNRKDALATPLWMSKFISSYDESGRDMTFGECLDVLLSIRLSL